MKHRPHPEHHINLKLGPGWHKRNFITEVWLPSLFTKRDGINIKPQFPTLQSGQVSITWTGHASFLIQTPETNLLIDPNWAQWLKGIKRMRHPGLEIKDLPQIDLVLITHAHFDHLDRKTLRTVADQQPIVVPEYVGNLVHTLGFHSVYELKRWESFRFRDVKVTLTPACHWGARLLHDSHRGFGGFLIEVGGRSLLHSGDTAYLEGLFASIAEKAHVDIALLPIGAYETPSHRNVHMTPEEAVQAFLELGADTFIPMHYGTFRLSYEPLDEPPARLKHHAQKHQILHQVCFLSEGQPQVF